MEVILIPARGGSKGIKRKNLSVKVSDKPILQIAIETALKTRYPVWVSSEDKEILELSETWGAKAHERDEILANDTATLESVVDDFIEKRYLADTDILCAMQCTSPYTKTKYLLDAIDIAKNYCSCYSAVYGNWHIHTADKSLTPERTLGKMRPPRQMDTLFFMETGAFYANSVFSWLNSGRHRASNMNRIPYIIPKCDSLDIDSLEDIKDLK